MFKSLLGSDGGKASTHVTTVSARRFTPRSLRNRSLPAFFGKCLVKLHWIVGREMYPRSLIIKAFYRRITPNAVATRLPFITLSEVSMLSITRHVFILLLGSLRRGRASRTFFLLLWHSVHDDLNRTRVAVGLWEVCIMKMALRDQLEGRKQEMGPCTCYAHNSGQGRIPSWAAPTVSVVGLLGSEAVYCIVLSPRQRVFALFFI